MTSLNVRNKKERILTDAYNEFITTKEINLLSIYMLLYFIFSLDILPKNIILGLLTIIFFIASLKNSFLMYLFFSIWENVTIFSFGITLNLVFQVLLFTKILLNSFRSSQNIMYRYSDLIFLLLTFFYGMMNYLIGTRTLSGISISFNVFIAMYAFSIYSNKEESTKFWEATFCTLMISTLIATFYGIINDTTLDRWVKGMGYARQLYGTVGTARIGMFLCTSLIYPVFYVKNRFVKIVLSLVLSILALMTLSVTTLICLIIFWMFVILFKDIGNFKKNVKTISIIIVCLIIVSFSWSQLRKISFIRPITLRIDGMIEAFRVGDLDRATSTRSFLIKAYMEDFKNFPIINKIFGSFYVDRFNIITGYESSVKNYAHNSFIDLLMYTGILGIIVFFAKILERLKFQSKREEFLQILIFKMIFALTGLSVSMLSSTYWFIWMIL